MIYFSLSLPSLEAHPNHRKGDLKTTLSVTKNDEKKSKVLISVLGAYQLSFPIQLNFYVLNLFLKASIFFLRWFCVIVITLSVTFECYMLY